MNAGSAERLVTGRMTAEPEVVAVIAAEADADAADHADVAATPGKSTVQITMKSMLINSFLFEQRTQTSIQRRQRRKKEKWQPRILR